MSLHKYGLTFSQLTPSERADLIDRLEKMSWNGLFWDSDFQNAQFFIDEKDDPASLNVPASCHLTRLYQ